MAVTPEQVAGSNKKQDVDPIETKEWIDALNGVIQKEGVDRAAFLIDEQISHARVSGVVQPFHAETPYINTIPVEQQAKLPGDQQVEERIRAYLPYDPYTPAAGQGALGIETLSQHPNIKQWLAPLNDAPTLYAVSAERMVSRQLGGSCEVPLAAHAVWDAQQMQIQSFVASTDGKNICLAKGQAKVSSIEDAEALGLKIANELIAQGAMDLIPKMTK